MFCITRWCCPEIGAARSTTLDDCPEDAFKAALGQLQAAGHDEAAAAAHAAASDRGHGEAAGPAPAALDDAADAEGGTSEALKVL